MSLKASAQSEGKYYWRPHDPRSWQQPEVKWGNSLLFLDTEITRPLYGLFSRKWYLSFVATCTQVSDFYLQLLAFSVTNLRSFRHVLSCNTMVLYYAVEMYVYLSDDCQAWHCFWISLTCQLGHSNQLMIFAAVGWDAWLLTRERFRRLDFRGGNSKLSLRITSFLNSKALLRYYNLQVFSSSCHQDLFCHMQSCLRVGS